VLPDEDVLVRRLHVDLMRWQGCCCPSGM